MIAADYSAGGRLALPGILPDHGTVLAAASGREGGRGRVSGRGRAGGLGRVSGQKQGAEVRCQVRS